MKNQREKMNFILIRTVLNNACFGGLMLTHSVKNHCQFLKKSANSLL